MTQRKTKYPIGWQSFEKIRTEGALYVDKTGIIDELLDNSRFVFLSRPRRFGKSLLLSTIEAFFQGRKDLFEGLKISQSEREWDSYPVLHFDMSRSEANNPEKLELYLNNQLAKYERDYQVVAEMGYSSVGERLGWLIENVSAVTGKHCVILVDEYDKALQETLQNRAALEGNQSLLRPFFSQLKTQDKYIKFAMVTGVARFRHYTLFSGANNLEDISFMDDYAAICGITLEEMKEYFQEGVCEIAKKYAVTIEQMTQSLLQKYDGYRFTQAEVHVFNPFSLLNAFKSKDLAGYWLMSGTSKVFVDFLKQATYDLSQLRAIWASRERLSSLYDTTDPIPLLFQTGYLTIADYNREIEQYLLKVPNGEVRGALFQDLAPMYLGISATDGIQKARMLRYYLNNCDLRGFVNVLDSLIAHVPYPIFAKNSKEESYHLIVYCLCMAIGVDIRCEEPLADGRPDLVAFTEKYIYVIEFKLDHSAETALTQIEEKGYARPYLSDKRAVYRIGASFSSEKRNIQRWLVQTPEGEIREIKH
ncbi:MAG: ATP-binding protein [Bacteroidales bacterium]|nr:ATP-binding protein [Bacteroidales bacterium]